jgi:pimeloyl-ACP methyl ester carboxylesterase
VVQPGCEAWDVTAPVDHDGWTFREAGPGDASAVGLLLPGALCSAAFYADVLAEPAIADAGVRLVAATPPGFGGNPAPAGFDMSIESYAELVEHEAERLGCDAVVGHSHFANVLIEVAARGRFRGPLVLLSPCFSREDEEKDVRQLDRIARVPGIGALVFRLAPLMMSSSMKGRLPEARHDELVREMKKGARGPARQLIVRYFDHLDRHGSLVARLVDSGVPAWVVRGDEDEIGLTDSEAAALEAAPSVTTVTIPGARHFSMTDEPAAVARTILSAIVTDPSHT